MALLAFGINHTTAPIDIREQVAFSAADIPKALKALHHRLRGLETALVSTCNRTEIYATTQNSTPILDWLCEYHHIPTQTIAPYTYEFKGYDAVRHVMRVASGLDSMALGEPQILGQMKSAYTLAHQAGCTGITLNRLFQTTFELAKKVRTDTTIGSHPISIAFAATILAKKIFSDFSHVTALFIGAGETISLVARHLKENGVEKMIIANRTLAKAQVLMNEISGKACTLEELPQVLPYADIVVSCTASPVPILGKGLVETALKQRKHRPIFMVDLAVPRDIEPEVSQLKDAYLYSIDDMQKIVQDNFKLREQAANQAENIIYNYANKYCQWKKSLPATPTITHFRNYVDQLGNQARQEALAHLHAGTPAEEVIHELVHKMTQKFMHQPSVHLKEATAQDRLDLIAAIEELYDLKHPENV